MAAVVAVAAKLSFYFIQEAWRLECRVNIPRFFLNRSMILERIDTKTPIG